MAKIEKLKKMASCQQEKVNEISEWAEIVIDKSNRKTVQKTMTEKQRYLDQLKQKNKQLEVYLCELANEEELLLRQQR
jgi:mevalonate kinase